MDYTRQWQEQVGSEDSHGRALWGIGKAVAYLENPGQLAVATTLFHRALKAAEKFESKTHKGTGVPLGNFGPFMVMNLMNAGVLTKSLWMVA